MCTSLYHLYQNPMRWIVGGPSMGSCGPQSQVRRAGRGGVAEAPGRGALRGTVA